MAKFPVSGNEIPEIDLKQITVSEWRSMFDMTQSDHDGDNVLAKACGMKVKDIRNLPLYDYRALFQAVLEKANKPLDNDPKN